MLAGAAGFEPANGGIKSRCLTTWRRPTSAAALGGRARTEKGLCAAAFAPAVVKPGQRDMRDVARRDCLAEQITLELARTQRGHELGLGSGLDPFGSGFDPQAAGQGAKGIRAVIAPT